MTNDQKARSETDPGFRRMMMWVLVALIVVLTLAIIVVEMTLRWLRP
jgi:hypothetical protein